MFSKNPAATLVAILENSLTPQALDSHAWSKSLLAQEDSAALGNKSPGQRLMIMIAKHFLALMPVKPPQPSPPLNERWGGFAMLAAQYFAPLLFGKPAPASLEESAARMYESVLLFVGGDGQLTDEQKWAYRAIEQAQGEAKRWKAWRKAGIQMLADALVKREAALAKSRGAKAVISGAVKKRAAANSARMPRWAFFAAGTLIAALGLAVIGWKLNHINALLGKVETDAAYIQSVVSEPEMRLGKIKNIGSGISLLRADYEALQAEIRPFFWAAPFLQWHPKYGKDAAQVRPLAALVNALLTSADLSYQSIAPLVEEDELSAVNPSALAKHLSQNQLALQNAYRAIQDARRARSQLDLESLSPATRELVEQQIDPLLQYLQDGLTVAVELPNLMGAGKEGAKTYLLLVQNENELRPTGGFITAASAVEMREGELGGIRFVNSGNLDNWRKIYPAAPWQLKEYMNSPVLVFRDANWHTDYRTAALYAKYLYSYANEGEVDGVIAFDQRLLIETLSVMGAIQIEGEPFPIDANNVARYMRASKSPNGSQPDNWDDKAFLNKIAYALLEKIFSGEAKWEEVSAVLLKALNERHLLIQTDNPALTAMLARYHWDGSLQPGSGDFLMAVDTNIGYNKTNAVVESTLEYDVDLRDPTAPTATLITLHKNNAKQAVICKQWLKQRFEDEQGYPITDCYWNYLRVYKSAGTALLSATPQVVPDAWMINRQSHPGRVDILSEEISGVQAFGALEVVPAASSLPVSFTFALPPHVLRAESDRLTYALKVQKQPGTLSIPLTLRIQLPPNARLQENSPGAVVQEDSLLYETKLTTDLEFIITFAP